ncbi:MAG TPA: cytochrome c3 family protein, partial [Nitrospirota bacterium]
MHTILSKKNILLLAVFLLLGGTVFLAATTQAIAQRKFEKKECLDCHKKFSDQYLGMKNVHQMVKEKKCEDCHLRHGKIPKLLLKKPENDLCYTCHPIEKMGLDKGKVHTAVRAGKCTNCHNPHAS